MSCQEVTEFLDAYLDNELEVVAASQFDRHVAGCASCRARYAQYREMQRAVQGRMEYFRAPEDFAQKLRASLFPDAGQEKKAKREWFPRWQAWTAVACLLAVLLTGVALFRTLPRRAAPELVAEQVVSSHIRSLQANHLSDVISSDQHTVKPWFTGKLDFAPSVKDLASQGFPLAGGRLDYLDNRAVAALVYKRRQHTINLFLWPSETANSAPRLVAIKGFNVLHWTHSHMAYWAVSDVNAADLTEFARDLQQAK